MSADVARTMAARLHAPGDVRVAEQAVERPGPGEVLLRVGAVGLCGSDLHWFGEGSIGDARLSRPLVLGHEFAAVIESGPRAGERVAADPAWDCGQCEPCRSGRSHLCLAMRFAGHGVVDGALRTWMAWPERLLETVPASIGDDEAALLEPLGVALHALDLAGFARGERAGVYGCGPLGLLLVSLLRQRGASAIVATDRLAHRVEAAAKMGATQPLLVEDGPEIAGGRRAAREIAVDAAFEVAGSDAALSDAIAAVRPGGRVVIVGIPPDDRTTFEAAAARRKELTLQLCRRMRASDLAGAIQAAVSGRLDLGSLISHRYPLSHAAEAFETLAARSGLKVIVNPPTTEAG